jgi:hypothetical protein
LSRHLALASLALTLAACSTLLGIDHDYVEGAPDAPVTSDATLPDDATAERVADSPESPDAGDATTAGDTGDTGTDAACAGHVCQGICLAGPSCVGCAAGNLFCAATRACVSSCTACQAPSTECWSCTGAQPSGSCESTATAYCLGAGYTHCTCSGDAGVASCPGASQTCKAGQCASCGEPGTDGSKCKSTLDCAATSKMCH